MSKCKFISEIGCQSFIKWAEGLFVRKEDNAFLLGIVSHKFVQVVSVLEIPTEGFQQWTVFNIEITVQSRRLLFTLLVLWIELVVEFSSHSCQDQWNLTVASWKTSIILRILPMPEALASSLPNNTWSYSEPPAWTKHSQLPQNPQTQP